MINLSEQERALFNQVKTNLLKEHSRTEKDYEGTHEDFCKTCAKDIKEDREKIILNEGKVQLCPDCLNTFRTAFSENKLVFIPIKFPELINAKERHTNNIRRNPSGIRAEINQNPYNFPVNYHNYERLNQEYPQPVHNYGSRNMYFMGSSIKRRLHTSLPPKYRNLTIRKNLYITGQLFKIIPFIQLVLMILGAILQNYISGNIYMARTYSEIYNLMEDYMNLIIGLQIVSMLLIFTLFGFLFQGLWKLTHYENQPTYPGEHALRKVLALIIALFVISIISSVILFQWKDLVMETLRTLNMSKFEEQWNYFEMMDYIILLIHSIIVLGLFYFLRIWAMQLDKWANIRPPNLTQAIKFIYIYIGLDFLKIILSLAGYNFIAINLLVYFMQFFSYIKFGNRLIEFFPKPRQNLDTIYFNLLRKRGRTWEDFYDTLQGFCKICNVALPNKLEIIGMCPECLRDFNILRDNS